MTMRGVMPSIPPEFLELRKRTGADRYDEMWDGVLHMAPVPNRMHQDLEWYLETYLRQFWAPSRQAKVYHEINLASIGGWPKNYRIPDLVLLLPHRFAIDCNEYFEGAPSAIVEIHSPDDESYEKLPFYATLGVPEAWIIHCDSKEPELYVLKRKKYSQAKPVAGWLRGPETGVELARSQQGRLAIRIAGDDSTRRDCRRIDQRGGFQPITAVCPKRWRSNFRSASGIRDTSRWSRQFR
jgi:Uma2 family endonuclease